MRAIARAATPHTVTAAAVTALAVLVVAAWANVPVRSLDYHAGASGRPRTLSAPTAVPILYDGFAAAEPWGRWSDGDTAAVRFGRPLPRDFELTMTARAFGANAGAPVRVCAGSVCEQVRLEERDTTVSAAFSDVGRVRRLVFHIPHPTAPGGADERRLGIGLVSLHIEEAGA